MAQINWHQVNAHLVNALHAMQMGWGKVRDYVTRVEEPEWEFDPPIARRAAEAQECEWDDDEEDCILRSEEDDCEEDDYGHDQIGPPSYRSDDPIRYDAYYGRD